MALFAPETSDSPIPLYFAGFNEERVIALSKILDINTFDICTLDIKSVGSLSNSSIVLWNVEAPDAVQKIIDLKFKYPELTLVLFEQGVAVELLEAILSKTEIYSVVSSENDLRTQLKKAIEYTKDQRTYFTALDKVKKQNRSLEELKENLEDVVLQRTKKEYFTSSKMEKSVKEIQSILSFIKDVSRIESIEDLLAQIKNEFKRIHGLMPPLLIVENETGTLRCFYFQGKQLFEKKVAKKDAEKKFPELLPEEMRSELSNFLGRPFSSIAHFDIQFRSGDLSGTHGLLIFEHSLGEKAQDTYSSFAKQRWPIINMALESLLLKEGLQDIAKQWSKTFNEMSDPIAILDRRYKISLSNGEFLKNQDLQAFLQSSIENDKIKDFSETETFETGLPASADIRVEDKIFRVHSYPIKMEGFTDTTHVINQYVDVTQTIDLQSRVIQGEKMAAVGLLAGNIAHELNNPLTGIFSLSELLLQDIEEGSNLYKDLIEVKSAASRCQRIIKDLLEFSDLEEGNREQVIDLNALIQKTLPLLKMAMRTLNSDINLHEESLFVRVNPQLLQQVLFNLINNACQAMDDGGYLYVTSAPKGETAEVRIRDTGPGIPEEIRESIFEPFFTTKEEGKGTGLGLSMSKSVVERCGGKLILNLDLDTGTEFVIELPMVDQ